MNSYLEIAERVLKASRRPMTARGILNAAYKAEIVPKHLHGQTQHKTLQARLSEDILHFGLEGKFFRTDPGRFFLCEFRSDSKVLDKHKDPFHARRRTRDLSKKPALSIQRDFIERKNNNLDLDWIGTNF